MSVRQGGLESSALSWYFFPERGSTTTIFLDLAFFAAAAAVGDVAGVDPPLLTPLPSWFSPSSSSRVGVVDVEPLPELELSATVASRCDPRLFDGCLACRLAVAAPPSDAPSIDITILGVHTDVRMDDDAADEQSSKAAGGDAGADDGDRTGGRAPTPSAFGGESFRPGGSDAVETSAARNSGWLSLQNALPPRGDGPPPAALPPARPAACIILRRAAVGESAPAEEDRGDRSAASAPMLGMSRGDGARRIIGRPVGSPDGIVFWLCVLLFPGLDVSTRGWNLYGHLSDLFDSQRTKSRRCPTGRPSPNAHVECALREDLAQKTLYAPLPSNPSPQARPTPIAKGREHPLLRLLVLSPAV